MSTNNTNLEYSAYGMSKMMYGLKDDTIFDFDDYDRELKLQNMEKLMNMMALAKNYEFKNVRLEEDKLTFNYKSIIKDIRVACKIEIGNLLTDMQLYHNLRTKSFEQHSDIIIKFKFEMPGVYLIDMLNTINNTVRRSNLTVFIDTDDIMKLYQSNSDPELTYPIIARIILNTDLSLDNILDDCIEEIDNLLAYYYNTTNVKYRGKIGHKYNKNTHIIAKEDNIINGINDKLIIDITPNIITALNAIYKIKLLYTYDTVDLYLADNDILLNINSGLLYLRTINGKEVTSRGNEFLIGKLSDDRNSVIAVQQLDESYNDICLIGLEHCL